MGFISCDYKILYSSEVVQLDPFASPPNCWADLIRKGQQMPGQGGPANAVLAQGRCAVINPHILHKWPKIKPAPYLT